MLYGFRRLISLKILLRTLCSAARVPRSSLLSRRSAGQITTILVLILVALLIFILVTLNINQVSTAVLAIANGTDAAAMKLGSSLGSRSRYLYDQLGGTEKCVRGGLLGVVLAVILAVVMWYAAPIASPLVSAMIGGAIGGAIGNVIVFGTIQAAFQGAIMGALIGASLAGGFGAGAGWTTPGVTATQAAVGGLTTTTAAGVGLSSAAISAGIIGATVATAAAAYNAGLYLNNQNTEAVAALTKGLSRHGEYTALRESIFYEAFTHSIDDPTLIPDTHDLDGDEDTSEMVPYFDYWWYDHINSSDSALGVIAQWVDDFMVETLIPVYEQIRLDFLPLLDRKEVECACSPGTSSGELLLSALYDCEYGMSVEVDGESAPMYEPGPDAGSLISWRCAGDEDSSPAGWDGMDALRQNFEDFVNYARTILEEREDECGIYYDYNPDELAKQLKSDPCADQV
ncbi:MAG: hypothetical protein MJA29_05090, partial [Candidatus Omnitrophica bacterium]|nr:hypothetical protein [Candidatus Omnitrophota bacterium]